MTGLSISKETGNIKSSQQFDWKQFLKDAGIVLTIIISVFSLLGFLWTFHKEVLAVSMKNAELESKVNVLMEDRAIYIKKLFNDTPNNATNSTQNQEFVSH